MAFETIYDIHVHVCVCCCAYRQRPIDFAIKKKKKKSTPRNWRAYRTFFQADYAEERLDAHEEFEEELNQALYIRKMVDTGMHDRALARLMASTEVRHVCYDRR